MERNKAQLELDWQRRLEESEREVCSRQDELIKAVTRTRDEVIQSQVPHYSRHTLLSHYRQWHTALS